MRTSHRLLEQQGLDVIERYLGVVLDAVQQIVDVLRDAVELGVGRLNLEQPGRVGVDQRPVPADRELFAVELLTAGKQLRSIDHRVLRRQDDTAFDDVFEFADVARPVVRHHGVDGTLRETGQAPPMQPIELGQEVRHQQRNVLAPLAHGRHADRKDIEAEEQILAEAPGRSFLAKVDVRRRDDAHIHAPGVGIAEPLDLAFLEHAQEVALGARGQRADLVEEQGAAVSAFEAPRPTVRGTGEGAAFGAEQFRLDQ